MIMNVKKHLRSVAHLIPSGAGLVLIFGGAFLISVEDDDSWWVIPAYIMIGIGFGALLIGIFWNICNSMKSKMYRRRQHEQRIQVFTIERPNSSPPSYEETQVLQVSPDTASELVVVVDGVNVVMNLAPPLYSQDSSGAPDCRWSWEQPPRYSQVEHIQQGELDAELQREALSAH